MNIPNAITLHQTLHGYDDGHRLLRASRDLAPDVQREMLALSDSSGQSSAPGFDPYLTAYPLAEAGLYAWSRTWSAPEMKRPGCVWTHTLLVEFADLALFEHLAHLHDLLDLLHQPDIKKGTIQGVAQYETPIMWRLPHITSQSRPSPLAQAAPSSEMERRLLFSLYDRPNSPVFLLAPNAMGYEELILSVWLQQWPRLRRQFAFCTGVTTNRKRNGQSFDLQVAPVNMATKLQREVPDATLLLSEALGTKPEAKRDGRVSEGDDSDKDISWLDVAVKDLSFAGAEPKPSLRGFFRHYGADVSAGRSEFAALGNVFAWIEKVNASQTPSGELAHLLEVMAGAFPRAKQAHSLKNNVFGRPSPNDLLKASDTEVVHALATTPYYRIFDTTALNVQARVEMLWKQRRENAEALLLDLGRRGNNPFVEDVVSAVARHVTPQEALSLFRRSPSLGAAFVQRNRTLVTSPTLWQGSVDLQRELFDTLAASTLTEQEQQSITAALFNAGAGALADEVKGRFGDVAASSILKQIEVSPRPVPPVWHSLLTAYPAVLATWLSDRIASSSINDAEAIEVIAPLLVLSHPTAHELKKVSPREWTRFVDQAFATHPSNAGAQRLQTDVCAFVLSRGLFHSDKEGSLMVQRTFQLVHNVLGQDRLSFTAWKWLEAMLPSLGYKDWDKCERLRLATIERWVQRDWPISQFINSIKDEDTLQSIILSCQQTPVGEDFFKRVRKNISDGSLSVPAWQKPLWTKKKKFINALLDQWKK